MASRLARATLARAAHGLNARAGAVLPPLILMTDAARVTDPVRAARGLPKGSAIILRHTDAKHRAMLALSLMALARERDLVLLIAGDPVLAARIGAHGLHLPEARASQAAHWKALRPAWLVTVAAHSARALNAAARGSADAALLAPVFPTASHHGRPAIGAARFRLMARDANLPVYALGGVNAANAAQLKNASLAGIAAIDGLIAD